MVYKFNFDLDYPLFSSWYKSMPVKTSCTPDMGQYQILVQYQYQYFLKFHFQYQDQYQYCPWKKNQYQDQYQYQYFSKPNIKIKINNFKNLNSISIAASISSIYWYWYWKSIFYQPTYIAQNFCYIFIVPDGQNLKFLLKNNAFLFLPTRQELSKLVLKTQGFSKIVKAIW